MAAGLNKAKSALTETEEALAAARLSVEQTQFALTAKAGECEGLAQELQEATAKHEALQEAHATLEDAHAALQESHAALQDDHTALECVGTQRLCECFLLLGGWAKTKRPGIHTIHISSCGAHALSTPGQSNNTPRSVCKPCKLT